MNQIEQRPNFDQLDNKKYETAKKKPNPKDRLSSTAVRRSPNIYHRISRREKQIHNETAQLEKMYKDFMEESQYTKAQKTKATIKYLEGKNIREKARKLSEVHSIQKQEVKSFHQQQIKKFKQAWNYYMYKQSAKERILAEKLKQLRKNDEEQSRYRIARRCQSAKPTVQIAKLKQLQETEIALRKRGKTVQLRRIRDQKKLIIQQCNRQQKRIVQKIAFQQQRRIAEKETRRYKSFMHRIQQNRKDNERIFKRQEYKLKQKFKNVMKKLQSQQIQDFNQLFDRRKRHLL